MEPVTEEQFFTASKEGDISIIKRYIHEGSNVNVSDIEYQTPLMYASNYGHIEIVKLLFDAGADVNSRDDDEDTAIVHAIWGCQVEIVEMLINACADLTVISKQSYDFTSSYINTHLRERYKEIADMINDYELYRLRKILNTDNDNLLRNSDIF